MEDFICKLYVKEDKLLGLHGNISGESLSTFTKVLLLYHFISLPHFISEQNIVAYIRLYYIYLRDIVTCTCKLRVYIKNI